MTKLCFAENVKIEKLTNFIHEEYNKALYQNNFDQANENISMSRSQIILKNSVGG
jgi:hypothetical protein